MSDTLSIYHVKDGTYHLQPIDARSIKTSLARIAVANVWFGVLLTLAVALVLQSTARQRKGPVFFIQCFIFVLAFVYNSLVQFRAIWKNDAKFKLPGEKIDHRKENGVQVACLSLEHWIPLIADFALIFKILSFYPSRLYTKMAQVLRLAPTVLLLLPRIIIVSYLTFTCYQIYSQTVTERGLIIQLVHQSSVKKFVLLSSLDFYIQAVFCFFASCALLYKTVDFYRNLQQMASKSIKKRLRFFMEAIFMTFLPPLALSLACAVKVHDDDNKPSNFRSLAAALVNTSVVFSLLATSWSTVRGRGLEDDGERVTPLINQLYESNSDHSMLTRDIPMTPYEDSKSQTNSSKKQLINDHASVIAIV